jgi:hypothetical protein
MNFYQYAQDYYKYKSPATQATYVSIVRQMTGFAGPELAQKVRGFLVFHGATTIP